MTAGPTLGPRAGPTEEPAEEPAQGVGAAEHLVACVDFGSTFTKAALVDVRRGRLVAAAEHVTTLDADVMDGWDACLAELASVEPAALGAEVLACSSAGGGLRIAVVGNEVLVTAEAGRRVALSSGGRVVHVSSGGLDADGLHALKANRPDVVLLVGGTDGGNRDVLVANAARLADARWPGPVVVAGNVAAREDVRRLLDAAGTPYVVADNVVPRIGVLAPDGARQAVREMFLRHVIGGKHLSTSAGFAAMVRGATPDVVLTAVELLAGASSGGSGVGDVVVVDVGGATTDVYSVVQPVEDHAVPASEVPASAVPAAEGADPGTGARRGTGTDLGTDVVPAPPATRTVEGDLGVRWSAVSTVEEAYEAGFLDGADLPAMREGAQRRHDDPAYLPADDAERDLDLRLAALATGVALRRHAGRAQVRFQADPDGPGRGRWVERSGVDLRQVALLVGSGGALRHGSGVERRLLEHVTNAGGWQVPEAPRVVLDRGYLLAPAGLLAARHPDAAQELLRVLR